MRILHCLHAPPQERTGGVEVYTQALARALRERHEVALLYPGRAASGMHSVDAAPTIDGIRHFAITNSGRPRSFVNSYRNVEAEPQVEQVLDTFRPDVVHIQHLAGLPTDLPALAQARSMPVLMTLHDHWLECAAGGQRFHRDLGRCAEMSPERCARCTAHLSAPALHARALLARARIELRAPRARAASHEKRTPPLRDAFSRAVSRWTRVPLPTQRERIAQRRNVLLEMTHEIDRFLAPSRFVRDSVIAFGVPASSVQSIAFGIAEHHHAPKRTLPETVRVFGYLGGITPHKGVDRLIDAFNELPADARLDVVGNPADDARYAASLRERARHPGIRFCGPAAPADVPTWLREIECLVVPSLWYENAPLVIREAFCAGLPVVASNLGGHAELLGSDAGLLYDPDVREELGSCLRRLMRETGLPRHLVERQPRVAPMADHAREMTSIYLSLVDEIESPRRNPEARDSDPGYARAAHPSPNEEDINSSDLDTPVVPS